MKKYTKVKVIKISETQYRTLKKLREYNVNVSNFIREAISEKINRDASGLKPKPKKITYPF